jgi:hypothetical protein
MLWFLHIGMICAGEDGGCCSSSSKQQRLAGMHGGNMLSPAVL